MSVERFRRLLDVVRAYPALYSWLADGFAAVEDGRDLAEALELSGHRALRARNRLLANAAQLALPGARPWRQAGAVLDAIPLAVETRDRSALSRAIRDAAFYAKLPGSQRGIYNILMTEKSAAQFQYRANSGR